MLTITVEYKPNESFINITSYIILVLTGNILQEDMFVDALVDDWVMIQGKTKEQAFIMFLLDLRKRLHQHMKTLDDFGVHINPATKEKYVLEGRTELQDERARYAVPAQLSKYHDLEERYPSNPEQQHAFDHVIQAIETARTTNHQQFVVIHGAAGTGKSIVGQKLAAKVRSEGKLVSICASTTLAATNYENADTAHSLFGYAVQENDDDYDGETQQECQLDTKAYEQRLELLENTVLILWDEVFGNHRNLFEAAVRALQQNKSLVWVLIGDTRQPLVIIKYASDLDVIGATITSSHLWSKCHVAFLTENKRLAALQAGLTVHSTEGDRNSAKSQQSYAEAILRISEGTCEQNEEFMCNILQQKVGSRQTNIIGLPNIEYYNNTPEGCDNGCEWLHPGGDLTSHDSIRNKTILAITNERVDMWNKKIQDMNPNHPHTLLSHDYFADVDDPKGLLADMLTETILNNYTSNQAPDHVTILKRGDVCLITRPLKAYELASNSRVVIKRVSPKLIQVVTFESTPRIVMLPRMRFKFNLQDRTSFTMTRVQFPLRLCYSMTTNKSQGQSFEKILLDLSDDSFSHGQTYVALSRVRRYDNIRLIVRDDMVMDYDNFDSVIKIPMIVNIVFPTVIQRPPTSV